jgi:peptidyl-prolyl cis-trans isomerase SurA
MLIRWSVIALLLFAPLLAGTAEVLDRTVATVNGHVILLSDWDEELRFECLNSGRKLAEVTAQDRKAALDRLIDQQLLREQMRPTELKAATHEQIEKQIQGLKDSVLRDHAGESWEAILSSYQLGEKFVEDRVATELVEFGFIDARFRPTIQVSASEIEQYYKEQLVPKLPASDPVALSDVTAKIREILVEKRINQLLGSWLEALRSQAQIRMLPEIPESGIKSPQVGAQ